MLHRIIAGRRFSAKTASRGLRALSVALAVGLAAGLALSCGGRSASYGQGPTAPNPPLPTAQLRSGPVVVTVELARNADQRERGLMFRKSLADGKGMLFVFDADQILDFWMKNTTIPLSIAYMSSDGTVREIHDLEPLSLASVASGRSVRYALEVPRGWFDRVGLKAGDRFELPPLD
jgi:hypothetical protein